MRRGRKAQGVVAPPFGELPPDLLGVTVVVTDAQPVANLHTPLHTALHTPTPRIRTCWNLAAIDWRPQRDSKKDSQPSNHAKTRDPDNSANGAPDLRRSDAKQGRTGDDRPLPSYPRHDAAEALADAVLLSLRSGDLVTSRAAARALSVLVDALTDTPVTGRVEGVRDLGDERRRRGPIPK